jgi:hypothetical protein
MLPVAAVAVLEGFSVLASRFWLVTNGLATRNLTPETLYYKMR